MPRHLRSYDEAMRSTSEGMQMVNGNGIGQNGPVVNGLAPNGMPIVELNTTTPVTGALDQAAVEQAYEEGRIKVTPIWGTVSFRRMLMALAAGIGVAWVARKQRWV